MNLWGRKWPPILFLCHLRTEPYFLVLYLDFIKYVYAYMNHKHAVIEAPLRSLLLQGK